MGNNKRWLLFAVAAVIAARLAMVFFAHSLDVDDDADGYLQEGLNIWNHGTFSPEVSQSPHPAAHDLPLFPLMLSGFAAVFKTRNLVAKAGSLANCFLYGIAAAGVYRWSILLTGRKWVSRIALLIFGFAPQSLVCSVCFMPESLFLAFLVWSLVHFTRFVRGGPPRALWLSFALWGLSVLSKPISLYFGPILAAIAVWTLWRSNKGPVKAATFVLLSFLAGVSILIPWSTRNYIRFGDPGLTSVTGENLFWVNYRDMLRDTLGAKGDNIIDAEEAGIRASLGAGRDNPMRVAAALGRVARRGILDHPGWYLFSTLKRHPRLYTATAAEDMFSFSGDSKAVAAIHGLFDNWRDWRDWPQAPMRVVAVECAWQIFNVMLYAATAVGLWKLTKLPNRIPVALLLVELGYFAFVIGPNAVARYRMTMLPAFAIAAAYGIASLLRLQRADEASLDTPSSVSTAHLPA